MASAVFLLCFGTSLLAAVLLLRAYAASKARLLLWSGLCFIGFSLNNILLFVDRILLPNTDLFWGRTAPALIGLLLLMYGLIWEAK